VRKGTQLLLAHRISRRAGSFEAGHDDIWSKFATCKLIGCGQDEEAVTRILSEQPAVGHNKSDTITFLVIHPSLLSSMQVDLDTGAT